MRIPNVSCDSDRPRRRHRRGRRAADGNANHDGSGSEHGESPGEQPGRTGFLGLFGALKSGALTAPDQERIALAVAEANGCSYCLSAHTQVSRNVVKLPEDEIQAARRGESGDAKSAAILRLTLAIVGRHGHLDDTEFDAARAAGLTDEEIVEVVANVARNIFTNYVNETLGVDIEWPLVTPLAAVTA